MTFTSLAVLAGAIWMEFKWKRGDTGNWKGRE